ncbi:MAG: family 43 glycosylhydrolase [Oscillospiraceae bacterium]|nr:family 43 glycosylhydrolase [Oscillospiraceae bacterium]
MKLKRVIGAAVVSAMIMPYALPTVYAADTDPEPILWYDFEDGAKDASGNGLDGTVYGASIEGSSAVFDGTDDYIKMPDGILQNAESATVAIYLKPEIEKANQFTWCIGNTSTTGYMFLNTYNPNSKLRAAITLGTYTAESELATGSYVRAGEWTSVIAVFDGENSVLYRDGAAVATANISIKPSDLGATTANYIAKSVYNDPYFKGMVSDFRIYDKALTAEEAAQLSEEQKSSYTKTAPSITGVSGDGIKSYGVEIDTTNRTIFIPVQVGTDFADLTPEFACESAATVTLMSGTYKDGIVTVEDAEDPSLTAYWTVTAAERGNAVLDGYYADPNIAVFDGKYYIYPTTDGGSGWDAPYFKCFSSDDLVHWKDEGVILDLADVSWSNGKNGWAPTITEKNDKYYFYYSAAPSNNGAKKLAVAVADSPTGPFVDQGVIVSGEGLTGQMIDSVVFTDDDGQSYLYWGNGALYGAKLSEDMLHIDGEIKKFNPSNYREAPFIIKRNGIYYMMWSDDDTGSPNYHVRYGTLDSPLGTLTGNTQILHRNNAQSNIIKGTGHHSVINIPGTDEWYICYHRFNTALYGNQETQSSAAGNHRETCIDKLEFDENGNIKPVIPTLEGITEPVYAIRNLVYISETKTDGRSLKWSLSSTGDISDVDIYTVLYNSDNTLASVAKNQMNGEFEIDPQLEYTLKIFTWEKDGMKPIGDGCAEKQIKADTSLEKLASELVPDKEIRGNQYMPDEYNGVKITWSSDNDSVKPDGTVTRGAEDIEVNITAVYDNGAYTYEKTYQSTVLAAPVGKSEDDMGAYLFVHFVGTESNADCEQIYFSVSKDGQNWTTLNEKKPILTSVMGEGGTRDPHIVRSPEGDKFFLIATDLSIYNRRDDSNRWGTCQVAGSKSIMIWESTDLVNWSDQRMAKVAVSNAGCTWAPESVYDYEKGQYMVFWASKVSDDNYSTQRIYRCYTPDFKHFTDPEVYIGESVSNIDTTFINHDGVYYRFTKNENKSSVTMMKSESLNGTFTDVPTYTLNGAAGNTVTGYEGPTIYKLNGENKWCLLLDYYSRSQGYKPFVTDDITKGQFVSAADFNFDTTYRHGTVMPITLDEYRNLLGAYAKAEISGPGRLITGSAAQYSVSILNETIDAEWSVSDTDIAEIDDSGLLTAKTAGKVTVTAYLPDYSTSISKSVTIADAAEGIDAGLVMNITFDEENTGSGSFEATDGGTVTEKGTVSYADGKNGKALSLTYGTGNYLELPDGVLSGAEEASVSFWVKQGSADKASWPFMTTPVGSQTYKSEKYIGLLLAKEQNKLTAERYYSNNIDRPAHASTSGSFGDWNYVTVNFEAGKTTIYINGKKAAEQTSSVNLENIFTAGAKSWIGHANWDNGEGFVGMIDDFRLYSRTLTEDEITTLMNK